MSVSRSLWFVTNPKPHQWKKQQKVIFLLLITPSMPAVRHNLQLTRIRSDAVYTPVQTGNIFQHKVAWKIVSLLSAIAVKMSKSKR